MPLDWEEDINIRWAAKLAYLDAVNYLVFGIGYDKANLDQFRTWEELESVYLSEYEWQIDRLRAYAEECLVPDIWVGWE